MIVGTSGASQAKRLFRTLDGPDPHGWLNYLPWTSRSTVDEMVEGYVELLESLVRPDA